MGASVGGGQGTAVAAMNFDAVGEGLDTVAVFASLIGAGGASPLTGGASFVTVTKNTSANTAGDLKVVLEYLTM